MWKDYQQTEIAWFYEPDTFRPMARVESGTLLHIVNDHLGTPKEAVDPKGRLVWSADHDTWGTVRHAKTWRHERAELHPTGQFGGVAMRSVAASPDANLIPIRFQGQWEDAETGLYYNRFRYYEPGAGVYCSSDPLGFAAGPLNHAYVSTPSALIDPWGLQTLYRNLRFDEDPCSQGGIFPKAPHRTEITPEGHVMKGSDPNFKGSPYISTTKDIDIARKHRADRQRTVAIDSEKVGAEKIDVSAGCCLKGRTAKNWAAASKEVLINGMIPCSAIIGFVR